MRLSVSVQGSVPKPDFAVALTRANQRISRLGIAAARTNLARHTKSGKTMRELRARVEGPFGVEWYDRAPQALFLEEGTRPHVIRPRTAKALRFPGSSGRPVFARRVEHPGTSADPWLELAIRGNAEVFGGVYAGEVAKKWDRG